MKKKAILSSLLFASAALTRADFAPIALNPTSFNQDVVVEKNAIHSPVSTTASMDEGSNNTGFGWYEVGYNTDAPDTGLPAAGSTVTSLAAADHSYTFAPSYAANNALLLDTNLSSGTLTLDTPTTLAALSLLTSAGHGPATNTVTIHYANGTSETATFVSRDWFGADAAVSANGRLDVRSLGYANVSSGNPNLYSADIPLSNTTSAVTSIDFQNGGLGNSHTAVFAVSGASQAGGQFAPLAVHGFNRDLVVEAAAPHPLQSLNATTASMDAGIANTGFSWYERGYNTNALPTNSFVTGFPAAGSTVTNASAPDHKYVLAGSYTENNALLVDADNSGTLTFSTPAVFSSLSLLTSAGNGSVTIAYTVNHADGSSETGTFTSQDWFNNANPAFIANGRVNVIDGGLDNVNGNNPRLYPADIMLSNTNSPIASIDLSLSAGTGHAAIFAVSGALGNVAPLVADQPVSAKVLQGGDVQFTATVSGTLPIAYAWQVETNGAFVNLSNGGNVSGANTPSLTLSAVALSNGARYRLAVTNSSGSSFSIPATLTVISTATSVTAPGDLIEAVGGTSPGAEGVEHVIDQDTAKYLNFGTDGDQNAPFAGPVGFVVTPTLGSDAAGTVVNAIRVYTANDAPERDPASFTIEGSNGGTNFTLIASGNLALPDARNNGGLTLDPIALADQEVHFANSTPYKSYRVLFQNVKNNTSANSVQLGEVELLGTVASSAATSVSIARNADGTLTISSSTAGTLQSTTALGGNGGPATVWTDEGPINGSVTVTPTGKAKFYRVLAQQ